MPRSSPIDEQLEHYRRELVAYCYRFFGCFGEAEDAVQETMLRAWQRRERFEGRSSLRTWLYSIATNVCLDMRRAPQRRALPTDLLHAGTTPRDPSALRTRAEETWIGPIADAHLPQGADPAEAAALRESVRLAFITALQHLPPRQRAALILRDVLAFSARECADVLGTTAAAVNSALARARERLDVLDTAHSRVREVDEALLGEYVDAFESYDVDRLVALLAVDAVFTMPPFELWLAGAAEIERWWRGPGEVCRNARTMATRANGQPAVAVYHEAGDGQWTPFAIHLVETARGRITAITHFVGAVHFAEFGLPDRLMAGVDAAWALSASPVNS